MNVTHSVLKEIGAGDIPYITVFNKTDKLQDESHIPHVEGESLTVSAKYGTNMDELTEMIRKMIFSDLRQAKLLIPYDKGAVSSYLMEKCNVSRVEYIGAGTYIEAELNTADYNRLMIYFTEDFESIR
jgi:GTP-binding protein HflX